MTTKLTWRSIVLFFAVILFVTGNGIRSLQARDLGEYDIKAAYLFKLCQLVTWPKSLDEGPFVISIVGEDPFNGAIDKILADKEVHGHELQIRRAKDLSDIDGSRIIFVGKLDEAELEQFIESVKGINVLTVGESELFASSGGVIGFVEIDDHIRLQINVSSARRQGLKLSTHLLSVADLVSE